MTFDVNSNLNSFCMYLYFQNTSNLINLKKKLNKVDNIYNGLINFNRSNGIELYLCGHQTLQLKNVSF